MERIVMLGYDDAVKAIENAVSVFCRHGVWNKYQLTTKESAIKSIKASGYGADVYKDTHGGLYVSVPCDSDMW